MDEYNQGIQQVSDNRAFMTSSIIQIRLDTEKVLEELERYLNGSEIIADYDEKGNKEYKELQISEPKANKQGIYDIMGFIKSKVNSQIVQGFFASDSKGYSEMYEKFMDDVHDSFTTMILENCEYWDIEDNNIRGIINTVIHMVRAFLTRLIGDKERLSYAQTFKTTESTNTREQSGFNLFRSHKRG